MLIDDFSLETVEVGGYPIQTFKNRFRNLWEMFFQSTVTYKDEIYLIEGQKQITFGQAADLAIRLAAHIKEKDRRRPGRPCRPLDGELHRFYYFLLGHPEVGGSGGYF